MRLHAILYMCPHTAACAPILLYMCPHTTTYVSSSEEVWLYAPACNPIYVSSYCYICVLLCTQCLAYAVGGKKEKQNCKVLAFCDCVQSYMCAHIAIYVSYTVNPMCPHTAICVYACYCVHAVSAGTAYTAAHIYSSMRTHI